MAGNTLDDYKVKDGVYVKIKALYGFQGLFVKLDEWKIHF